MQNRNITSLEDNFERRFSIAMNEYNLIFKPSIFIVEALRTKAQQIEYVKSGASKTMFSNHLTWKAVDIAFYWPQLYPTDQNLWDNLLSVMHKYWIVNWFYDLKRWFDKPHFQPVEMQKPLKPNGGYTETLNRKEWILKEIANNSAERDKTTDSKVRDRLSARNKLLRAII